MGSGKKPPPRPRSCARAAFALSASSRPLLALPVVGGGIFLALFAAAAPPAQAPVAQTPAPAPAPAPVAPAAPVTPPPAAPVQRPVAQAPAAPRAEAPRQDAPRHEGPRPAAPAGQTRTYEPSRDRRDDRPSTTTYRPAPQGDRPFNQRAPRPDAGANFGQRAPRPEGDRPRGHHDFANAQKRRQPRHGHV